MSIPNPGFPRPGVQYDFQNESQFRAAVQAVISALDAEIQGDTAILAEHDIVGANHTASGLTTGHVLQATGATTFGWQPLDFTDIGGTIADAQVPETAVTQHEAALTILETQITDGALLARVGGNETITGSWTFTDGTVTFDPGNAQSWIDINTDLANYCGIHFQHNNLTAFEVSVDNGTNNFYIYRWNPDGTRLGPEIAIAQATGKVTISNDLDITGFNVGLTGINSHTAPTATGSQLLVRDLNDNGYVKVITPPTANGTSYYLRFNSSASGFTWQPVDFASPSVNETITGLWDFSGIIDFGEGITVSNGSNWYIDATQNTWIEINPTADGSAYTGGWARYIGWNAGGGGTPPEVQMGVLGGTASVTYLYLTANATRGTGHYNLANTLRIKPDDPFWYDGTAERRLTYDDSASNFTMTGIWTFDRINVNADSYFYGTTTARYLWFDLGNGVTPQNGGFGWRDNGANEWLFRMDTGLNLEVYNYNVAAVVTQWDSATGDLRHSRDLYLEDSVTYPADGLLYVTSTGLVASSGASAQYDIPYNIDGSAWSYISKGANPDGSVLMLVSGIPQWAANTASQADTLYTTTGASYEDGDYYRALSNATGTLAVTKIQLLAESTVIIGGASANETRALTGDDIDWSAAFGAASTQIYLDGASSSFRSSLGLYAAGNETNINFTAGYIRGGYVTTGATGAPANYHYILSAGEDSRGVQIAAGYGGNDYSFYIRRGSDNAASENGANAWQNWKEIAVNGTDVAFTFSGDPCLLLSHTRPEIRFYETDGPTDEKYWRMYAAGGVFSLLKMSDAASGTATIWSVTRSGTTADFSNWYIHDIRYSADGNDAQYHRWYANSNTGQTHLEFRRTFDSAMGWRITGQASTGDFYLSNYNFSTLQEHWIFGDASSGELTFDGQRITLTPQIRASATYDNSDQSAATLNVNWDNGNSQRCQVNTGNATIAVNQATAYQGTSYTMEVTNVHSTTGRTVTWTGVSQWVGSAPTATVDAGKMTVVQLYVARNRAGSNYIIGSVILDNVTVPT